MAQHGRRPVYEPEALAFEKACGEPEDEFGRRVRMHAQGWLHLLSGRMLRPAEPLYLAQLVSHRVLRYGSGLLHLALFASSLALAGRAPVYRLALPPSSPGSGSPRPGGCALPLPGAAIAYHYLLLTSATLAGLVRALRGDVPAVWEKAVGTR